MTSPDRAALADELATKSDLEVARLINLALLMCDGISEQNAGFDTITGINDAGLEKISKILAALRSPSPYSGADELDPADVWYDYCEETRLADRSCQGALAYGFAAALTPRTPITLPRDAERERSSTFTAMIENLVELDKQRTPGPWKKTHDNITVGVSLSLVARCDADWNSFKVDMAKAGKNARFIVALENAWPKILAALAAPGRDAERETMIRAISLSYARNDLEPLSDTTLALYRADAEHAADAIRALPSIPPREGPLQSTTEQADASRDHPVREANIDRVAAAIMTAFIKKWFLGTYKGPVYFDCVNGEKAWGEEAKAAIAALSPSPTSVMPDEGK